MSSIIHDWGDDGVRVNVPTQSSVTGVQVVEKDWDSEAESVDGQFVIVRKLINFAVLDEDDNPFEPNPEIEVTVCYSEDDVDDACDLEVLKLGYWANGRWNILDRVASVTCPFTGFDGAFGFTIDIEWGDPAMAWGK